jgi:lipopolysaccharide export system protein LptA
VQCAPILGRAGARVLRGPGWCLLALLALASFATARAEIELPAFDAAAPVSVTAEAGNHWSEGSYEIWLLRGNCRVRQGETEAHGDEAVLWVSKVDPGLSVPRKVTVYLEGNVTVEVPRGGSTTRIRDTQWLGRFTTRRDVEVRAGVVAGEPQPIPPIYARAVAERDPRCSAIRPAQYAAPLVAGPMAPAPPPGARRIRAVPRGDVIPDAQWFPDPSGTQWIAVIDSGVTLIVEGLQSAKGTQMLGDVSSVDVSADRLVIWTSGPREPDLTGQTAQSEDVPLEIYLEGNIVFRQGTRVIYADRMYYDVRRQVGTVINAEVLTPVKKFEGLVRLHTQLLQQTGPGIFVAENSYFTSSRLGEPGYRVQAGDVTFEDFQQPVLDPATGEPVLDPATGEPQVDHQRLATGRNGMFLLGGIPVFYWPVFSTNLDDTSLYIRRLRYAQDDIFGTQVLSDWNVFQLLGIRKKPVGTDWGASIDYMNRRGLGHGTTFTYQRPDFFGMSTPSAGLIDYWGIQDKGSDQLIGGRPPLKPDVDYRYRLLMQHRQQLGAGWDMRAEVGLISDRNFLEQYFLHEWNEFKDESTGFELRHARDNQALSITSDVRVNDFFTQTEWLPRLDHFRLGDSLLNDSFTWYQHSSAAYAKLQVAEPPSNPAQDPFLLLPWEYQSSGERLISRHEIDWPFQAGPVKVVPYALGEAGHWGEDLQGNSLDRLYGQAGLRASMPVWRTSPEVESNLWNVHGIAHKIVFDAEVSFADANRDLSQLPLYDAVDDDSVEAYRHRYSYLYYRTPGNTHATIPARYDERYFALRSGMASWVTAQGSEIADDLAAVRMGVRQRWQTKRGMPGQRKIIDWITLDTNLTYFPNADRDNYGTAMGLWDYDFRWHVGDRLTLVSDGFYDFFDGGLNNLNFGVFLSHPPRGNLFLGFNFIEGPLYPTSRIFNASYSYWMSPKWISSAGISIDLDGNSIGHNITLTRVGESFLISAGFSLDAIRNNAGVNFAVEPRFVPRGRLGGVGGARVPIAGAYGLE